MPGYSDLIERALRSPELLQKLVPTDILDRELWRIVRDAPDAALAGSAVIADGEKFALVRGALLNALDDLDGGHRIFQDAAGDLGAYWHGVMHRREGDFDNARYWFRRAGALPFFGALHGRVAGHSPDQAKQGNWDPYLFTGQCEQARFGDEDLLRELRAVQRAEFDVLLDYSWRQSVAP